jgi:hypothetical protein
VSDEFGFGWDSPRPVLLASNVRKARASATCSLCRCLIQIGTREGRLPGGRWAHVSCIVERNRSGARPHDAREAR